MVCGIATGRERRAPLPSRRNRSCRKVVHIGAIQLFGRRRLGLRRRFGKHPQIGFSALGKAGRRWGACRLEYIRKQFRAEHAAQTSGDR